MSNQASPPVKGEQLSEPLARDTANEYRRLAAALASKAQWLGSRDPESAAQETLTRSLENPAAHAAIAYYFGRNPPDTPNLPEWQLDRLLAWLYAALRNVVREERSRASFQREVPVNVTSMDPADPGHGPLETMIQDELQAIVVECFPKIERTHRQALTMRADGLKYGEIAFRLGVNENTVATWVSRGIRELGRHVRKRMGTR